MGTNTDGVLSQAIANMQASEKVIAQFSGLPSNAVTIQQSMETTVNHLVPQIQSMQADALSFADSIDDEINNQLAILDTETDVELQSFVDHVQQEAKSTQVAVDDCLEQVRQANKTIAENSQALQTITVDLKATIAGLQSNLDAEQRELDALNKQKYYLIGLGIFGIPGLIALAVLISNAQDKVHHLESQVRATQNQINQQESFLLQTQYFTQDLSDVMDKVGKVANSISFIVGDIDNIASDIQHGDITNRDQIRLYFMAANQELKTLIHDVS